MPPPSDLVRLRHMLDAGRKATSVVKGRGRPDLDSDEILGLALVRLLEIIGEAAKGISEGVRRKHPRIPWSEVARTRDRLIHGYFDVDLDIVWAIVTQDLPPLIDELKKAIPDQDG